MLVAVAGMLSADSDTRPKTAAEKSFFQQVLQTCSAATAGIKTTWDEDGRSGDDETDYINTDSEKYPLVHYFSVAWRDSKRIQEADAKTQLELAAKVPDMKNSMNNDANKELEQLAEKLGKAAEAGNFEEVGRLQKQIEELAKRISDGFAPVNQELEKIIERNVPRDVNLRVRIAINKFYESFDGNPKAGKLADGTLFYRRENGRMFNGTWVEGTTLVVLGSAWKLRQDGETFILEHPEFAEKPSTTVRTVVVGVQAEEKRAMETINSMDFNALKALLN